MKKITTLLLMLLSSPMLFAQKADRALAKVRYSFIHITDTTDRDQPYKENMLLVVGNNASVYTSYDKLNHDLNRRKQIEEQIKNQTGSGSMRIDIKTTSGPVSNVDYFYFINENKFFTKERVVNNYLIEEKATKLDWKITRDTMSFSGVHCQKATTRFKGRNWIAWFAPEIPFQAGPWKLNGLPGLIIDAYDEKKEVKFEFAGIENIKKFDSNDSATDEDKIGTSALGGSIKVIGLDSGMEYLSGEIKLPADAIKTTKKELDKLKEAKNNDPEGFMQAQMAAQGITGNITRKSAPASSPSTIIRKKFNNPIELTDK